MSSPLRPRLVHAVALPAEQVLGRLNAALDDPEAVCLATRAGRHLWLQVRPEVRHTWSPWLDLEVVPSNPGSVLRGRFGPHPSIWSFFAAVYAICAFCAVGGLVFGLSQLGLGFTPWGLWALPAAAVLAAGTFGVALIGKRLAREQMREIRTFLEEAIGHPLEPATA